MYTHLIIIISSKFHDKLISVVIYILRLRAKKSKILSLFVVIVAR
jgi:hypothetical protein